MGHTSIAKKSSKLIQAPHLFRGDSTQKPLSLKLHPLGTDHPVLHNKKNGNHKKVTNRQTQGKHTTEKTMTLTGMKATASYPRPHLVSEKPIHKRQAVHVDARNELMSMFNKPHKHSAAASGLLDRMMGKQHAKAHGSIAVLTHDALVDSPDSIDNLARNMLGKRKQAKSLVDSM